MIDLPKVYAGDGEPIDVPAGYAYYKNWRTSDFYDLVDGKWIKRAKLHNNT